MADTKGDATPGWGKAFPTLAATAGAALSYSTFDAGTANVGTAQRAMNNAPSTTIQHHVDERFLNAKLDVVEARTETKFAQLLGKLDQIASDVSSLKGQVSALDTKVEGVDGTARASKREIIIAIIATGLAVAALAWAGVQIFQSGLSLSASAFQSGMDAQNGVANVDRSEEGG